MTPHYSWTPASEPPDTSRRVVVYDVDGFLNFAHYGRSGWYWDCPGNPDEDITHWRDVEPPDVEPPK